MKNKRKWLGCILLATIMSFSVQAEASAPSFKDVSPAALKLEAKAGNEIRDLTKEEAVQIVENNYRLFEYDSVDVTFLDTKYEDIISNPLVAAFLLLTVT